MGCVAAAHLNWFLMTKSNHAGYMLDEAREEFLEGVGRDDKLKKIQTRRWADNDALIVPMHLFSRSLARKPRLYSSLLFFTFVIEKQFLRIMKHKKT